MATLCVEALAAGFAQALLHTRWILAQRTLLRQVLSQRSNSWPVPPMEGFCTRRPKAPRSNQVPHRASHRRNRNRSHHAGRRRRRLTWGSSGSSGPCKRRAKSSTMRLCRHGPEGTPVAFALPSGNTAERHLRRPRSRGGTRRLRRGGGVRRETLRKRRGSWRHCRASWRAESLSGTSAARSNQTIQHQNRGWPTYQSAPLWKGMSSCHPPGFPRTAAVRTAQI